MVALACRFLQSLRRLRAGVWAVAVLACASAVGQEPGARLDVAATPLSVTRSTAALPTYASYRFTITSLTGERLKDFSFKGTVAVPGLPVGSNDKPALFSADGATCTLSAGILECAVPGELASYGTAVGFTITLKTPAAGSAIDVSGQAAFLRSCCHPGQTASATASAALTAPDPNGFSTYLPPAQTVATRLYSGINTRSGVVGSIPIVDTHAVPPINDPFTTTVIVPAGSAATTASVAEREVAQSCSANPRCFESKLVIPGSFDFLTIILRRDRSTLMSGPYSGQSSIDNAIVKYFPDDDPANPDRFIIVPNCSVVPGGLPTPKNPCIASRKAYPPKNNRNHEAVPPGLEGDWEFVIRALDNGRYVN